MFEKILIANRGEIAVRIMQTARKMGIKTVAVYSEADTNSLHVQYADEAVYIGRSPVGESYLVADNIIAAITKTGAEAVHPGYGFLSENSNFARLVEKAGAAFIGPPPSAIAAMGDKIEAKRLAKEAGVSSVPGFIGVLKTEEEAVKIAREIGYPVILKAAAGGGGRGMRIARSDDEVKKGFVSSMSEAKSSFGDGRVFIEKFIEKPRHIEIQILGDKHGNIVFLGERECSIQRRHQKVIEEAPSIFITKEIREKMGEQSKALARNVGYYSAGTMEFIVDGDRNFYFLEMNTRLQVEHRVTELVTGIDLVEQMIRVAFGEKLGFTQKDVKLSGWAIEARIYAEDPSRGFLPSIGRLTRYQSPETSPNVLVDTGVYEGGEVSMFYDPMIAKLCSKGAGRNEAIEHMQTALGEFNIHGVSNNLSFLEAVMRHPRFISGDISTNFIAEEYPEGFLGAELNSELTKKFLAVAVHIHLTDARRAAEVTGQLPGRKRQIGQRWVVSIENNNYPVTAYQVEHGYDIEYNKEIISVRSMWTLGSSLFHGNINGSPVIFRVRYLNEGYSLTHSGSRVSVVVRTPRVAELARHMPVMKDKPKAQNLAAPMSGRIVALKTRAGEVVKTGEPLIVIEAMKMENVICADHDVKVTAIHVSEGESVAADKLLMDFG